MYSLSLILICCTWHIQGGSPFFLCIDRPLLLASLQCQISALTWGREVATYSGSLVQLCCGERGTLQTNITGMWESTHSGWTTWGLPQPKGASTSQVQATQTPECSMMAQFHVGRASHAFPWSKPLSFPGVPQGQNPRWSMGLLGGASLRLWHSWQIWITQDPRKMWLVTGRLLTAWQEMQSLGPRLQWPFAFNLWLSCTCLSASGQTHNWQLAFSPLVFTSVQIFVLWVLQGSQWAFH